MVAALSSSSKPLAFLFMVFGPAASDYAVDIEGVYHRRAVAQSARNMQDALRYNRAMQSVRNLQVNLTCSQLLEGVVGYLPGGANCTCPTGASYNCTTVNSCSMIQSSGQVNIPPEPTYVNTCISFKKPLEFQLCMKMMYANFNEDDAFTCQVTVNGQNCSSCAMCNSTIVGAIEFSCANLGGIFGQVKDSCPLPNATLPANATRWDDVCRGSATQAPAIAPAGPPNSAPVKAPTPTSSAVLASGKSFAGGIMVAFTVVSAMWMGHFVV